MLELGLKNKYNFFLIRPHVSFFLKDSLSVSKKKKKKEKRKTHVKKKKKIRSKEKKERYFF